MHGGWICRGSVAIVLAAGVFAPACGSDDEEKKSETGGSAGTTGGSGGVTAGSGGTGGGLSGSGGSGGATDGGSGASGSAGDCTVYGEGPECQACLDNNCCAEANACAGNASCSAFVECARGCPTPSDTQSPCVQACLAEAGPPEGDTYNSLILCQSSKCPMCHYF